MTRHKRFGEGVPGVVVDGSRIARDGWVTIDLDRLPFGPWPAAGPVSTETAPPGDDADHHADRYRVEIDTVPPLRPACAEAESTPLPVAAPGGVNDNDPRRSVPTRAVPNEALWPPPAERTPPAPGLRPSPRRSRAIPEADVTLVGRRAAAPTLPAARSRVAVWLLRGVDRAAWRRILALSLLLFGSTGNLLYQRFKPEPHAIVVPVPENPHSRIA